MSRPQMALPLGEVGARATPAAAGPWPLPGGGPARRRQRRRSSSSPARCRSPRRPAGSAAPPPAGVLVVAVVAALGSYEHMRALGVEVGEGWRAGLLPFSVDGLGVVAAMTMLVRRWAGQPVGLLAWTALVLSPRCVAGGERRGGGADGGGSVVGGVAAGRAVDGDRAADAADQGPGRPWRPPDPPRCLLPTSRRRCPVMADPLRSTPRCWPAGWCGGRPRARSSATGARPSTTTRSARSAASRRTRTGWARSSSPSPRPDGRRWVVWAIRGGRWPLGPRAGPPGRRRGATSWGRRRELWQPYYDDGTVAIYHGDVEDLAPRRPRRTASPPWSPRRPTTSGSTTTTTRPATPWAGRPTAT